MSFSTSPMRYYPLYQSYYYITFIDAIGFGQRSNLGVGCIYAHTGAGLAYDKDCTDCPQTQSFIS